MDVDAQDYVAAPAAVSAIGPAARDELFPTKAHATPAAIARLGKNFNSIDKHKGNPRKLRKALGKVALSRVLVMPSIPSGKDAFPRRPAYLYKSRRQNGGKSRTARKAVPTYLDGADESSFS